MLKENLAIGQIVYLIENIRENHRHKTVTLHLLYHHVPFDLLKRIHLFKNYSVSPRLRSRHCSSAGDPGTTHQVPHPPGACHLVGDAGMELSRAKR